MNSYVSTPANLLCGGNTHTHAHTHTHTHTHTTERSYKKKGFSVFKQSGLPYNL